MTDCSFFDFYKRVCLAYDYTLFTVFSFTCCRSSQRDITFSFSLIMTMAGWESYHSYGKNFMHRHVHHYFDARSVRWKRPTCGLRHFAFQPFTFIGHGYFRDGRLYSSSKRRNVRYYICHVILCLALMWHKLLMDVVSGSLHMCEAVGAIGMMGFGFSSYITSCFHFSLPYERQGLHVHLSCSCSNLAHRQTRCKPS